MRGSGRCGTSGPNIARTYTLLGNLQFARQPPDELQAALAPRERPRPVQVVELPAHLCELARYLHLEFERHRVLHPIRPDQRRVGSLLRGSPWDRIKSKSGLAPAEVDAAGGIENAHEPNVAAAAQAFAAALARRVAAKAAFEAAWSPSPTLGRQTTRQATRPSAIAPPLSANWPRPATPRINRFEHIRVLLDDAARAA